MKEVLLQGESLTKQSGSVWTERGGDSSSVAIPSGDVPRGNKTLEIKQTEKTCKNFTCGDMNVRRKLMDM